MVSVTIKSPGNKTLPSNLGVNSVNPAAKPPKTIKIGTIPLTPTPSYTLNSFTVTPLTTPGVAPTSDVTKSIPNNADVIKIENLAAILILLGNNMGFIMANFSSLIGSLGKMNNSLINLYGSLNADMASANIAKNRALYLDALQQARDNAKSTGDGSKLAGGVEIGVSIALAVFFCWWNPAVIATVITIVGAAMAVADGSVRVNAGIKVSDQAETSDDPDQLLADNQNELSSGVYGAVFGSDGKTVDLVVNILLCVVSLGVSAYCAYNAIKLAASEAAKAAATVLAEEGIELTSRTATDIIEGVSKETGKDLAKSGISNSTSSLANLTVSQLNNFVNALGNFVINNKLLTLAIVSLLTQLVALVDVMVKNANKNSAEQNAANQNKQTPLEDIFSAETLSGGLGSFVGDLIYQGINAIDPHAFDFGETTESGKQNAQMISKMALTTLCQFAFMALTYKALPNTGNKLLDLISDLSLGINGNPHVILLELTQAFMSTFSKFNLQMTEKTQMEDNGQIEQIQALTENFKKAIDSLTQELNANFSQQDLNKLLINFSKGYQEEIQEILKAIKINKDVKNVAA